MSSLRPFREVQLQWLRLLLKDTDLSSRAIQFAVYLVVVRYNDAFGMAWPSHSTVCADLGLKSEKTVQRLIKELRGKWFDIRNGSGRHKSTEYVPSRVSHKAAHDLREKEQAEKADKTNCLATHEGGHFGPSIGAKMSSKRGQKSPTIKENEKTKKKVKAKPEDRFRLQKVLASGSIFERTWNDRLQAAGLLTLDHLLQVTRDPSGNSYFTLPGKWPAPRTSKEWRLQIQILYEAADKEIPEHFFKSGGN